MPVKEGMAAPGTTIRAANRAPASAEPAPALVMCNVCMSCPPKAQADTCSTRTSTLPTTIPSGATPTTRRHCLHNHDCPPLLPPSSFCRRNATAPCRQGKPLIPAMQRMSGRAGQIIGLTAGGAGQ